jgi:hypothetical protein
MAPQLGRARNPRREGVEPTRCIGEKICRAANGFTTPGLTHPTDIHAGRLGAVKECHELR